MTTGGTTQRNIIWKTLLPIGVILLTVVAVFSWMKLKERETGVKTATPQGALVADLRVGAVLPDFGIQKFEGANLKASQLKGKILMINFWATWCEACMVEMPSIVELNRSYKDQGFELISIDMDDEPAKVLPRARRTFRMDFDIYTDSDAKLADIFDIHAIPLTIIMSHDRKILMIERGEFDWNAEEFKSQLKGWLSG